MDNLIDKPTRITMTIPLDYDATKTIAAVALAFEGAEVLYACGDVLDVEFDRDFEQQPWWHVKPIWRRVTRCAVRKSAVPCGANIDHHHGGGLYTHFVCALHRATKATTTPRRTAAGTRSSTGTPRTGTRTWGRRRSAGRNDQHPPHPQTSRQREAPGLVT